MDVIVSPYVVKRTGRCLGACDWLLLDCEIFPQFPTYFLEQDVNCSLDSWKKITSWHWHVPGEHYGVEILFSRTSGAGVESNGE